MIPVKNIAIGTVQFGIPYGITNTQRQIPSRESVDEILSYALNQEITFLDTAKLYGNSEEILGTIGTKGFQVISKLPDCTEDQVESLVEDSCKKLGVDSLYGYLLHSFQHFTTDPLPYQKLKKLQHNNILTKIGFSLYYPSELEYLLEQEIDFNLIQVPYSLLDRRFEPFFPALQEKGVEVHTRSTFLQGAFFFSPEELPEPLRKVQKQIQHIHLQSQKWQVSIGGICLGFVLKNPFISKGVIGLDSKDQLQANIESLKELPNTPEFWRQFEGLGVEDEQILVPSNWKLN